MKNYSLKYFYALTLYIYVAFNGITKIFLQYVNGLQMHDFHDKNVIYISSFLSHTVGWT